LNLKWFKSGLITHSQCISTRKLKRLPNIYTNSNLSLDMLMAFLHFLQSVQNEIIQIMFYHANSTAQFWS